MAEGKIECEELKEAKKRGIRTGEVRVQIADEEKIWMDRKRKTIFALPWSFTKYTLTASRLLVEKGFFTRTEEQIRLYRIKDVTYSQTFLERLGNTGTLCVKSSDASVPELHLEHIKNAKTIMNVLSQTVEVARRENGVRTSEIVGGSGGEGHHHGPGPMEGASLGPEMIPDADHDGIDDRLE